MSHQPSNHKHQLNHHTFTENTWDEENEKNHTNEINLHSHLHSGNWHHSVKIRTRECDNDFINVKELSEEVLT